LHEGGVTEKLNFSPYLIKLIGNLFQTYRFGIADISLKTELEENIFFDMDTAVPLGLIVNELISNSLKHTFSDEKPEKSGASFTGTALKSANSAAKKKVLKPEVQGLP